MGYQLLTETREQYSSRRHQEYLRRQVKAKAYQRARYKAHPESWQERCARDRRPIAVRRAYFTQKQKEWRAKPGKRALEQQRQRRAYQRNRLIIIERARLQRERIRLETFQHYGMQCACCGEKALRFLTLDHINNDGAAERRAHSHGKNRCYGGVTLYAILKKQSWPTGYQTLCFNCNCAKGIWGECPHKVRGQ